MPIDSYVVSEIVGTRTPDWPHTEPYSNFFLSQCSTSTSASASNKFCWANFSPLTANRAFRSWILWRFYQYLNDCTTFWSRSLFPFDFKPRVETTGSVSMSAKKIPWCYDSQPTHKLPTDSRSYFPNDPSFDTVGTLTADAVCLLLLEAPECRRDSRSSVVAVVASYSCGKFLLM